jgi:hypothetical protein
VDITSRLWKGIPEKQFQPLESRRENGTGLAGQLFHRSLHKNVLQRT